MNKFFKTSILALMILGVAVSLISPVFSSELSDDFWRTNRNSFLTRAEPFDMFGFDRTTDNPKDMYPGLFYPVQGWEINVCMRSLESPPRGEDTTYKPTNPQAIYQTTASIVAKSTSYDNTTLYEVYWFIYPKKTSITYSVSLVSADGRLKYPVPSYTSKSIGLNPDAGSFAQYLASNYTRAIIEFSDGRLETIIIPHAEMRYGQ